MPPGMEVIKHKRHDLENLLLQSSADLQYQPDVVLSRLFCSVKLRAEQLSDTRYDVESLSQQFILL